MREKATKSRAKSKSEDGVDATSAVLLTRERKNGVETSVRDVTVQRVVTPYNKLVDVSVDEIVNTLQERHGASAEKLTAILYENNDEPFKVPNNGSQSETTPTKVHGRHDSVWWKVKPCRIGYRVAVTLGDTGLGQSETLFKLFRTRGAAQAFADEVTVYDKVTFQRKNGEPQLTGEWKGPYKNIPEKLESSANVAVKQPYSMLRLSGSILAAMLIATGIFMHLGVSTKSVLLVGTQTVCAFFLTVLSAHEYLGTKTAHNVTALERDTDAMCTVRQLRDYIEPETYETHVGVSVERTDGVIRVMEDTVGAEWTIELEDGVIVDEDAASLLQSTDICELEHGYLNLVVQKNTGSLVVSEKQTDPYLKSTDDEWLLLPRDESERHQ